MKNRARGWGSSCESKAQKASKGWLDDEGTFDSQLELHCQALFLQGMSMADFDLRWIRVV